MCIIIPNQAKSKLEISNVIILLIYSNPGNKTKIENNHFFSKKFNVYPTKHLMLKI